MEKLEEVGQKLDLKFMKQVLKELWRIIYKELKVNVVDKEE